MDAQSMNTARMGKVNWRLWDELEKLTDRTKRLNLKISVLDQDSDESKALKEQAAKNFKRMAELVLALGSR